MKSTLRIAMRAGIVASCAGMVGFAAAAADKADPIVASGGASDESQGLAEIVVSARKRNERVLDIPESITAIGSADLLSKAIVTVEDLGRQTPNLQLNMRQDLTTNVVIRGVGAYGDVLGVGFNIDDVPNFTDQTMRLEDLESVEILKGPQGTLYGGSSIGGIVRYVSKKPSFDWTGEVRAEAGSYNQINVFAAQNVPLVADKLAIRVSAYDHKTDGYITNSALGINGDPVTDYGARAMFLYAPTEKFTALLTLRHSYIRNGADEYIPRPSPLSFTTDAPFFEPTFNTRSTTGGVLELNAYSESHMQFTSISSYTRAAYQLTADISFSPPGVPGLSLYTLPGNRPTEVATQEFRLTSPSGGALDWLVGLYGASIRNVLLNQNDISYYPPPPMPVVINDFDTKRTDLAAFGTVNYHIGRFTVGGGVRLGETRNKANVLIEAGGLPNQEASITTRAALPKLSLSYSLTHGGLVYANVSKGEEPGAVNVVSTAPIPYQSETATSYEVGAKGTAMGHEFEYGVAAFYVNNNNHQAQTNRFIPPFGLVSLISNVGDARTYGVEANAAWRPTPELTLGINGGYLNAKWRHAIISGVPIDGNTVPNSPSATGNFSAEYRRPVFEGLAISANVNSSYTSSFWWDLANTPGKAEPAYWIGNARISLGAENRSWEVALGVTNMFGAHYWNEYNPGFYAPGQALPCPGCYDLGTPGAPRQVMVSVILKH
jgi:iron complex outermembrane receptor protein